MKNSSNVGQTAQRSAAPTSASAADLGAKPRRRVGMSRWQSMQDVPFRALIAPPSAGVRSRYVIEWKPIHTIVSATLYAELKKTHPQVATKFQDELLLLLSGRLRQTTEKLVGKG